MIVLNTEALLREARTRASNVGLKLKFEEENRPRTDGTAMYVQEPDGSWDEDTWAKWWGTYEHELGHNIEAMTDVFKTMKDNKIDMSSFVGNIFNILDDHRQEHYNHTEYLGRRLRLEVLHQLFSQDLVKNPKFGASLDPKIAAITTIVSWDTLCREDWMPSLIGIGGDLVAKLSPEYQDKVSVMLDKGYGDTLKSGIDSDTEYQLAIEISKLFPEAIEQEQEQEKEEEEDKAGDDGGEGEGEPSDGAASEPSDGDDGDAPSGGDGGEKDSDREEEITKLFKHKHVTPGEEERSGSSEYMSLDSEDSEDSDGWLTSEGEFTPCRLSEHEVWYKRRAGCISKRSDKMLAGIVGHTLHKTLLRRIQCAKVTKYQHALKRGKLSSKSLYKAGVKADSPKVFKKKVSQITVDVAFTILVDQSGSMGGSDKYLHAASSVLMLNHALGALNIPTEIIGFDEGYTVPRAAVWKTFNKSINNQELAEFMAESISTQFANNSDGESILWAHNRLVQQKTKRKILLVLSDGYPESGRSGNEKWYTKMVVDTIQKKSPVELYGIGILSSAVRHYYNDYVVLNDTSDLEGAMLDVLERTLFNS